MQEEFDVFVCHASLDKQDIVLPIVSACQDLGIRVWLDSKEIAWGEDIVSRVAEGLKKCKSVLVVASENSVNRGWPLKEISLAMHDEITNQNVRVLPLFVGNHETVIQKVPILAHKKGLFWKNDPDEIASQIATRLGIPPEPKNLDSTPTDFGSFIPKLKGEHSDRDRDKFIDEAFVIICNFLDQAGQQFESSEPRIEVESQKPDLEKYRCAIYLDGNRKCQCQLWIDSSMGRKGINFFNGNSFSGEFSAANEMIRIDESTGDLRLSGMMGQQAGHGIANATPQEAAEVLWKWFVQILRA